MALTFLLGFATPAFATLAADSVYNYWIPAVCVVLEYAVLTELLYLWNHVARALTTKRPLGGIFRRAALAVLGILCIVATISLIVLRPSGPAGGDNPRVWEATSFRLIFFSFTLASTIFMITMFAVLASRLGTNSKTSHHDDAETKIFADRVRGFCFAASIALILRSTLDIVLTEVRPNEEIVLRVLEFLVHALPELILGYTFIGLGWRRVISYSAVKSDSSRPL